MFESQHHAGASSSSANFFPNASGTIVYGGAFIGTYIADDIHRYLEPLYKLVAPNAILNQGGRADEVRCYPGTREEVIAKVEAWRDGGYLLERLIFWLSGPAGAGKSAIVQTVAERCIADNIPMINFFFFRADGTRNHALSLIPTLLFQLFDIFPSLKASISTIIRENPLVFAASYPNQFKTLIINPILHLQSRSPSTRPVLLLIDGLDECDPKADQSALLQILHNLVNLPNSPFIVLVASRAESQIVMAFNSISTYQGSIFLDDSYRPSSDIRLYVRAELTKLRKTHTLCHLLGPEWPSEDDIDSIVTKSSGQFIYAATVVRYVSYPSTSPRVSLQTVLGIRLPGKRTPFAEIDALYTHILSQVDDWDFVRGVIFVDKRLMNNDWTFGGLVYMGIISHKIEDVESSLIVLAPIIRFNKRSDYGYKLGYYHASFIDFLHDRTRAGDFFLDTEAVATQLLHKICSIQTHHYNVIPLLGSLLDNLMTPTDDLTSALQQIALVKGPSNIYLPDSDYHDDPHNDILRKIFFIYSKSHKDARAAIIRPWVAWYHQAGMPRSELSDQFSEFWPAECQSLENCNSPVLEALDLTRTPAVPRPHSPSNCADLATKDGAHHNTPIAHSYSRSPPSSSSVAATVAVRRKWRFSFWKKDKQ